MALDSQTDMDFTPQSPLSTASNGTAPTPCEELTSMKIYLRRLQIICNEKERTVSLLRQDKGHDESDTLYQLVSFLLLLNGRHQMYKALCSWSFLSLLCTNPGQASSHHVSPKNTPHLPNCEQNFQQKRKR
ncbi:hypothetical protein TNCV_872941 [Trichonephila clavipes]|nr:hypothetical protein TNCV_872941 [Trichonephila clavipes]